MKAIKILFSISMIFTVALSACSGTGSISETAPLPTTMNTSVPTMEPTPEPIVLIDDRGVEITLTKPALRVISMAPSNTEILFAIGAGDQVVGRDSFSDFPLEAGQIVDIGGGFGELNTEAIIAANPDLILAADLTPPEQVQTLEDLGFTVFALPNPTDFDGLFDNLNTVARLTGHVEQADALVDQLKARVVAVETLVASINERPLVFYELDFSDPTAPWTAGKGTFIDTLITMAGGQNLGQSIEGAWLQISVEELIIQDPAIIILGDFTWGGVTPENVLARPGWEVISAVKNNLVFTFDDNLVSRPGPRLVDGLEVMLKLLHPELFQ